MEKARTTPEGYPLTLNSLAHACNQKTSREPITDFDEDEILASLDDLREKGLVMRVDMAGSRTAKFRENLTARWLLSDEEFALLATMFLRGAQTPGQLRQRSDRLHPFDDIRQVNDCLQSMQAREEEPLCLIKSLERLPGTKEIRYNHIYADDEVPSLPERLPVSGDPISANGQSEDRLKDLENKLIRFEERIGALERLLNDLTK
jgi:hypothetical protein